jgi:hypothetical protein
MNAHAIWDGVSKGVLHALALLFLGIVLTACYTVTRDAFVTSTSVWRTRCKVAAAIIAIAALVASTAGEVRDCSESDGLRIGCEIVDSIPQAPQQRWETFAFILTLFAASGSIGMRDGLRTRRRDPQNPQ